MSYNRIATPRMYMDRLSFDLATGQRTISNYTLTDDAGSPSTVTPSSGVLEDLFDLKPSNFITIAAATTGFRINIDTHATNAVAETNFLAILGHNFEYADAVFKVEYSDSSDFSSGVTIASNSCTRVINARAEGADANFVDPASNGWTLITWADNSDANNQYKRITVEDSAGGAFDQDVKIGAIMMGEYIDFPNSPDLDVGFSIDYEGSKLLTSAGGSSYAASSYLGAPAWAKSNPWVLVASAIENEGSHLSRTYGRRKYDMNFSYVADTNLFQSNMRAGHGAMVDGSDLYSQFYHKSLGQHLPFLFTIDGSLADSEGDYGLYRLADGGLNTKQVAHQAWNTSLSLVESW